MTTTTPTHIPREYQPGSSLRFQFDEGVVTVTVVHVFTPFTYSQVVVARTNHAHTFGQIHLPKGFLLIAKIYDVRFIMKERDGIFSECSGRQIEIPHPWSYELEACAAQSRPNSIYTNSDEYPERPDYDVEDQIVWENWIFNLTEVKFRDEVEAYGLCKSLQGHGIPHFYASGTLEHSHCSVRRAVTTRVSLLEYIQDAKPIDEADPVSITPAIVTSLISTVKSFEPLGVIHGDLNVGNILISSDPPRGTIIDFGVGGIRRSIEDETWREMVHFEGDVRRIVKHIRKKLKGYDLSKYLELHGDS
jgi:serine/threonine protein kinase